MWLPETLHLLKKYPKLREGEKLPMAFKYYKICSSYENISDSESEKINVFSKALG